MLRAIEEGPLEPASALRPRRARPAARPRARCRARPAGACYADGTGYVAVATAMPGVSGEMVDWWFDWHPRDPIRYRVWHPRAHFSNSVEAPAAAGAKAHWGTVHHPVEDVGLGIVHARIGFLAPSAMGFSTDALSDPRVATIVCGYAGDDRRHVRHTPMVHVFLRHRRRRAAAQPLLARCGAAPVRARSDRGAGRADAEQPRRPRCARCRAASRARWRATARRSTRTSRALLPELHARFAARAPSRAPLDLRRGAPRGGHVRAGPGGRRGDGGDAQDRGPGADLRREHVRGGEGGKADPGERRGGARPVAPRPDARAAAAPPAASTTPPSGREPVPAATA